MTSFSLPPTQTDPTAILIEPSNHAVAQGVRPIVPGASARLRYIPSVFVVLVLCLVGLVINVDNWRAAQALEGAGVPISGQIVDIDSWRLNRNDRLYIITFSYEVAGPDGTPRSYQAADLTWGDRREHGRFFIGKEVAARYLPSDPEVARFAESAPSAGWLIVFLIASGIVLIFLLYMAHWAWDDATLRRRGKLLSGVIIETKPSLWPRTQRVVYAFFGPDGREQRGSADIDTKRLRELGALHPGAPVAVIYIHDTLHTML